jgi:hypothetical protein
VRNRTGGRGVNFNDLGKIMVAVSDPDASTMSWNTRGRNAARGALGRRARRDMAKHSDEARASALAARRGRGALGRCAQRRRARVAGALDRASLPRGWATGAGWGGPGGGARAGQV